MLAMLRHLGLDEYIANENAPGVAKEGQPTEIEAQRKWWVRSKPPSGSSCLLRKHSLFGTPKKPTLNKPVTGRHVADALSHHMSTTNINTHHARFSEA